MNEEDKVFETAGELFSLLSTPVRLKILSILCNGEQNVSTLVEGTQTKQPNLSQHLNALYRAGILGRRRDGNQVFLQHPESARGHLVQGGLQPDRARSWRR